MQRQAAVLAWLAFSALLALGTPLKPGWSGEASDRTAVGPLAGMVVDVEGRAAAGAKVWLYSFYWEGEYRCPTVAETVTDEQGRFQIPRTEWDTEGKAQVPCLLARDSQGRLAPAPYLNPQRRASPLTDLRLTLQEVGVFQGRIVEPAGQPIAKATVRPTLVNLRGEIAKTVSQLSESRRRRSASTRVLTCAAKPAVLTTWARSYCGARRRSSRAS
jgi:hypothetical protein